MVSQLSCRTYIAMKQGNTRDGGSRGYLQSVKKRCFTGVILYKAAGLVLDSATKRQLEHFRGESEITYETKDQNPDFLLGPEKGPEAR